MNRLLCAFIFTMVVGCDGAGLLPEERAALQKRSAYSIELKGSSYKEIINKYGDPDFHKDFTFHKGDVLTELMSGLYRLDFKEIDAYQIRELRWEYGDKYRRIIWLAYKDGEWYFVDGIVWDVKKIKF